MQLFTFVTPNAQLIQILLGFLSTGLDQTSTEREEELEERRLTQRVHVFIKTLKNNFREKEELSFFSDLTNESSNRKKVASIFYSCLLLAKENTIVVRQDESYGDISIRKGKRIRFISYECLKNIYKILFPSFDLHKYV